MASRTQAQTLEPEPQTTPSTGEPSGNTPLDRSSPEWRSQFGVLPSQGQRTTPASPVAPAPGAPVPPTRGIMPPRGIVPPPALTPPPAKTRNIASPIAIIAVVIGVGALVAYGFLPSRTGGRNSAGAAKNSAPDLGGATLASGSAAEKLRNVPLPAPSTVTPNPATPLPSPAAAASPPPDSA
ncbi:MAG: hypothetical protein H7Z41_00285, partial [Cytophagales bacterium]|nr:hypothetical protein [Armatimonadota bacterium]